MRNDGHRKKRYNTFFRMIYESAKLLLVIYLDYIYKDQGTVKFIDKIDKKNLKQD